MLIADVPSSSVLMKIVERVFPLRPLCSQNQSCVHFFITRIICKKPPSLSSLYSSTTVLTIPLCTHKSTHTISRKPKSQKTDNQNEREYQFTWSWKKGVFSYCNRNKCCCQTREEKQRSEAQHSWKLNWALFGFCYFLLLLELWKWNQNAAIFGRFFLFFFFLFCGFLNGKFLNGGFEHIRRWTASVNDQRVRFFKNGDRWPCSATVPHRRVDLVCFTSLIHVYYIRKSNKNLVFFMETAASAFTTATSGEWSTKTTASYELLHLLAPLFVIINLVLMKVVENIGVGASDK